MLLRASLKKLLLTFEVDQMKKREMKFRVFDDDGMIGPDDLAFEKYGLLADQLNSEPTLMQYTGLKDKNGKEIYEGDIVNSWYEEYNTGGIGSEFKKHIVEFKMGAFTNCINTYKPIEVIGNIYENPELLEPEK